MPATARDRNLVSDEPWEIESIHRKFPQRSHAEVKSAIETCKKTLGGSEDREKVMSCVEQKLR